MMSPKISVVRFDALLNQIVREQFPEQLDAFLITREELVREVQRKQELSTEKGSASLEFGEGAQQILDFVVAALGTYGTLKSIYQDLLAPMLSTKASQDETLRRAASIWTEKLVERGLERKKAEEIAQKYVVDLIGVLEPNVKFDGVS